jgi:hypothetical protein
MDKFIKVSLTFAFSFCLFSSFAQEKNTIKALEGIWVGKLYNDTTRDLLDYQLAISDFDKKLSGYSRTTFIIDSIKNTGIKRVKINEKNGNISMEDEKLIDNNYTEPPAKGVRSFFILSLSENDSAYLLNGTWRTNGTREFTPLTGYINLSKKKPVDTIALIKRLKELGLENNLSFLPPKQQQPTRIELNKMPVKEQHPVEVTAQVVQQNKINPEITEQKKAAVVDEPQIKIVAQNIPEKKIAAQPVKQPEKKDKEQQKEKVLVKNVQKKKLIADTIAQNKVKDLDQEETKLVAQAIQKNIIIPDTTIVNPEIVITASAKNKKVKEEKTLILKDTIRNVSSEKNIVENSKKDAVIEKEKASLAINKPDTLLKGKKSLMLPPNVNDNKKILNPVNTIATISPVKNAMPDLSKRTIETIQSVYIKSDSLILTLYDNGTVDGDTVSVIMNGVVIMPRVGLSTKAYNKTIYLTPEMGDSINIIMYAENLGSIPPNTGLLVVRDGGKDYEIRFSGDLTRNSAIILRRKKL